MISHVLQPKQPFNVQLMEKGRDDNQKQHGKVDVESEMQDIQHGWGTI